MDEMKLKLTSPLMKGLVTKLIARALRKRFGYQIDIQLNDITLNVIDGAAKIHVDVDAEMDSTEFGKIVKDIM